MPKVEVNKLNSNGILEQINKIVSGELHEKYGEHTLNFDNGLGKGSISSIDFDWGVSLIDYEFFLHEDFSLVFKVGETPPLVFFYITEGSLEYCCDEDGELLQLNQYQNIIISNKKYTSNTLKFPKQQKIKANFIQIIKKNYLQKKNNNLQYLNKVLLPIVQDDDSNFIYYHLGNYNLKIADQIKKINDVPEGGIIRTLSLEGQLNLILAMQLSEHENYVNKVDLPNDISLADIKKAYRLKDFILNNLSESITIEMLSTESGLSSKKLQACFKSLFDTSVNVYVRELKLDMAAELLKTTDYSISEIVYNIGFKSRSYFSKIFFKRYNILPTEYRKRIKECD